MSVTRETLSNVNYAAQAAQNVSDWYTRMAKHLTDVLKDMPDNQTAKDALAHAQQNSDLFSRDANVLVDLAAGVKELVEAQE